MDVEKTIEFLLQQQAAADARWEAHWAEADARISASEARFSAQMDEINSKIVKLTNNQIAIQEIQFRQLEMINGLLDAQVRHEAEQKARSKEIDARLNALIAVVDDLVRRRN
jgi:hypothetical protein